MTELLKCPFCGHAAHLVDRIGAYRIQCAWCLARTTEGGSKTDVIELWNARAAPPAPATGSEPLNWQVSDETRKQIDEIEANIRQAPSLLRGILVGAASPAPTPAPATDSEPVAWQCMGRKQSLPEPGECNWPDCGCDPHATKVIESLMEQGWTSPRESQQRLPATNALFNIFLEGLNYDGSDINSLTVGEIRRSIGDKPALIDASPAPAPATVELELEKQIEDIIYRDASISHFGNDSEVDNAAYLARAILALIETASPTPAPARTVELEKQIEDIIYRDASISRAPSSH
jgi:hypothetical protein